MKHIIYFIVFLLLLAFVNARLIADVDIPSNSLTVKPGNSTYANLRLFRVDDDGRTDYFLRAYAIDDYGNKVSEQTKTITIDNELETVIELYIPRDAEPGNYRLLVELGGGRTASAGFIVEAEKEENIPLTVGLILMAVLVGFIIIFVFSIRNISKITKHLIISAIVAAFLSILFLFI